MNILNRLGITRLGGWIAATILALGLLVSALCFALGHVSTGIVIIFNTLLGCLLAFLVGRTSFHVGTVKGSIRLLQKISRNTHQQLTNVSGSSSPDYLSLSFTDPQGASHKEYEAIKQLLEEKFDLENQVLRQIVAESRLIRMSIGREDNSNAK